MRSRTRGRRTAGGRPEARPWSSRRGRASLRDEPCRPPVRHELRGSGNRAGPGLPSRPARSSLGRSSRDAGRPRMRCHYVRPVPPAFGTNGPRVSGPSRFHPPRASILRQPIPVNPARLVRLVPMEGLDSPFPLPYSSGRLRQDCTNCASGRGEQGVPSKPASRRDPGCTGGAGGAGNVPLAPVPA